MLLLLATLVAGCAGDNDDETATATGGAVATDTDGAATTETSGTETATRTPDVLLTAVFERSYSECGSFDLERLAAKYKAPRTPTAVANAVARSWTSRLGAGGDAVQSGRDGCLQALRDLG